MSKFLGIVLLVQSDLNIEKTKFMKKLFIYLLPIVSFLLGIKGYQLCNSSFKLESYH